MTQQIIFTYKFEVPQSVTPCFVCLSKVRQKYFLLKKYSAQVYTPRWQPQVIRQMFCKCFADQYRDSTTISSRKGWKCLPRRIFCIQASFIFLIEAIQNLPLEIREKIYKEFVTIKLREKERKWAGTRYFLKLMRRPSVNQRPLWGYDYFAWWNTCISIRRKDKIFLAMC